MRHRPWLRLALIATLVLALTGATTSPNKGYTVPTPFSDANVWGTMIQGDLNSIDQNLGGVCTILIASPATTATLAQAQCLVQKITGVLSQNSTYALPLTGGGFWIVDNETQGGFTLTVLSTTPGGTGFAPAQGSRTLIYSDGTNIFQVAPAGLVPSGNVGGDLAGSLPNPTVASLHLNTPITQDQGGTLAGSIVYDIASSTIPPSGYVLGNGQALSRTQYPVLNSRLAAAGYPYGAGDGSTTFNVIDCRANYLAGFDPGNSTGRLNAPVSPGVSANNLGNTGGAQDDTTIIAQMPSHNHSISLGYNDPGHAHGIKGLANGATGSPGTFLNGSAGDVQSTDVATTGITFNPSIGFTGGNVPHSLTPPTVIANCLVRAF